MKRYGRLFLATSIALARNIHHHQKNISVNSTRLKFGGLIYVNLDILTASPLRLSTPLDSGRVVKDFRTVTTRLEDHPKVCATLEYLENRDGNWATDKFMIYYRSQAQLSETDLSSWIQRRHQSLDNVYNDMKTNGWLSAKERSNRFAWLGEWSGLRVNVDAEGTRIVGDGGMHRLAMAINLGIREVPACFGVVAQSALD